MKILSDPEWSLYYLRVVIGDGEPERRVGDVFDWFAVSFWPEADAAFVRSQISTKTAVPIGSGIYRVNAEVAYISTDPTQAACILDFGIKAISDAAPLLPEGCQEGDYVTGEVRLELPLCTAVHPHDLRSRWRVNRVSADLTNFSYYPGDIAQSFYQDVLGTDSVQAGSYVLYCSQLDPS